MSTEQQEMQQLARKFAREEIMPNAAHYDKTGEVNKDQFLKKIPEESSIISMTILEEWLWRRGHRDIFFFII